MKAIPFAPIISIKTNYKSYKNSQSTLAGVQLERRFRFRVYEIPMVVCNYSY